MTDKKVLPEHRSCTSHHMSQTLAGELGLLKVKERTILLEVTGVNQGSRCALLHLTLGVAAFDQTFGF